MIGEIIDKINKVGYAEKMTKVVAFKVKLINLFSVSFSFVSLMTALIYYYCDYDIAALLVLIGSVGLLIPLVLNWCRLHTLAAYSYFTVQLIYVAILVILFGPESGIEYALFVMVIVPRFLFEKLKAVIWALSIYVVVFIVVQLFIYYQPPPLSMPNISLVGFLVKCFTLLLTIITISLVAKEKNILKQKNEKLLEQLSQKNKNLNEFNHIIAHDLKTPIRNIVSFGQLLKRKLNKHFGEDTDEQEYLNFINTSAKNMHLMFDDLLQYARIGQENKSIGNCNLNEVIADVLINLKYSIKETDAIIKVENNLPIVISNRSELIQVFQNLILNAIKYRKAESPDIKVTSDKLENGGYNISISDKGIGIAENSLSKIFKPFLQINSQSQGQGIGLAVCKKVMEGLGGDITIKSKEGVGTTFILYFPELIIQS